MDGQRVRVHSGDGTVLLGDGWYVGDVTVFFIRHPDGHLSSSHDAEKPPSLEEIPPGAQLVKSEGNPKIKLDNGDIVYGCQVWWGPIDAEKSAFDDTGWRR